ncbi:hypothetical protein ACFWVT_05625 [Streptomyces cyaneofuscatus]|uniref:hypothetical protein n=1 Tax=Streptomyces cyaneofuscatus TaxID=66883 RepID=UPI0036562DD7
MSSIDWGDAPTWIAAVFAGGAALFAGLTIRSQRQQIAEQRDFIGEQSQNLTLERAELRASQEQRRWAQAKQVSMTFRTAGQSGVSDYNASVGYDRWSVDVFNGSDEPIRDVMVRFGDTYNAASAHEVEANHLPDQGRRTAPLAVLGPGRTANFESPQFQEVTVDNNRPALQFTDAAGAVWRRDEHGVLTEVEE